MEGATLSHEEFKIDTRCHLVDRANQMLNASYKRTHSLELVHFLLDNLTSVRFEGVQLTLD